MEDKSHKTFTLEIPSDSVYLAKVEKLSSKVAKIAKLNESDSDDLGIVTTELVNNAIHHGNNDDKRKKVYICFILNSEMIELSIRDEGSGFNPEKLRDPLAPENLMSESGRGIFLIRSLMDSLAFKFDNGGTEVIITKKIN